MYTWIGWLTLLLYSDDCIGYDNCFVLSDPNEQDYQLKAYAPSTGIQLAIKTDQPAMQFYSCNGLDGTLPIKKTQGPHGSKKHVHHRKGGKKQYVQQYGCFVLETEEYIDGINNPQCKYKRFLMIDVYILMHVNVIRG